jgi:molybdopterin converting factor small subunit
MQRLYGTCMTMPHAVILNADEDVRYLGSLETELADGDTVSILPAVAGG